MKEKIQNKKNNYKNLQQKNIARRCHYKKQKNKINIFQIKMKIKIKI